MRIHKCFTAVMAAWLHTRSWPSAWSWKKIQCRPSYRPSLWVLPCHFLYARAPGEFCTEKKSWGSSQGSWLWGCSSHHADVLLQLPLILSYWPFPASPTVLTPSDDVSSARSSSPMRSWMRMKMMRTRRRMMSCSSFGDWGPVPGYQDH